MKFTCQVPRITHHVSRVTHHASCSLLLFAICCLLSACVMPGDAAPVIKIGVVAPFEGTGRPLGYAVLPGIKAAAGGSERERRPGPLPGVGRCVQRRFGCIHGRGASAGLGARCRCARGGGRMVGGDGRGCETGNGGGGLPALVTGWSPVPPSGQKWDETTLAQAATRVHDDAHTLLDALAADIRAHGQPTRSGVAAALRSRR